MRKFFLFIAVLAAMTVNAKVITFSGIVDKSSSEAALSTFQAAFDFTNITLGTDQNSDKNAWYVSVKQTESTEEWDVTTLYLKEDDQVYFTFKDQNDNKEVAKVWANYFQPAGKAACLVITGVSTGDKVTVNLKEELKKEAMIEGATVAFDNFAAKSVELTVGEESNEILIYSKNVEGDADAKWKLVSVEVPDNGQGVENVNATVKAEKRFENGQLVIIKNGVRYNAAGQIMK